MLCLVLACTLVQQAFGICVQCARPTEMLQVARLLQGTFSADANPVSAALIVAENVAGLLERIDSNLMLVARCDGADERVVGFVELLLPAWLASDDASSYPDRIRRQQHPCIYSLTVDPGMRTRGIATKLMRSAELQARDMGFSRIVLEVEDSNDAALSLYAKLGYTEVARYEGRKLVGDILFGRSEAITKNSLEKVLTPIQGSIRQIDAPQAVL